MSLRPLENAHGRVCQRESRMARGRARDPFSVSTSLLGVAKLSCPHRILCCPRRAPWRNFFRDFFASFLPSEADSNDWREIPGPSARPKGAPSHGLNSHDASANNSGTNTPVTGQSASGKTLADLEREEDEQERMMAKGKGQEGESGGKRPAL